MVKARIKGGQERREEEVQKKVFFFVSNLKVEFEVLVGVELESALVSCRLNRVVVGNVIAEILLDDVICELVDFNVFVILKVLNLRQSITFLDQGCDLFSMRSSHFQHVVNTVQDNLNEVKT